MSGGEGEKKRVFNITYGTRKMLCEYEIKATIRNCVKNVNCNGWVVGGGKRVRESMKIAQKPAENHNE